MEHGSGFGGATARRGRWPSAGGGPRVRLHGGFGVEAAGVLQPLPVAAGRRVRVATAYLVLQRGRDVPTDELADVLWDGAPPPSWPSSLREVLSHVRRLLAAAGMPHAVASRDRRLRVDLPAELVVDVEEVLAAAAFTRGMPGADPPSPEVLDALTSAARLRGADVLPGDDGTWLLGVRRRVEDARTAVAAALVDVHLQRGCPEEALEAARDRLADDPLAEPAHHAVMRCLVALGRRAEALAVYQRCRDVLADELGVDPSAQLRALHLEVLRDTTAVSPPSDRGAWGHPATSPRRDLGFELPLLGRAALIAEAVTALGGRASTAAGGPTPVVLLRGERGVGRTRLLHDLVVGGHTPPGPAVAGRCGDGTHPLLDAFPGLDATAPAALARGARAAVAGWTGEGTLTIVLDDVHLADEACLGFALAAARGPHTGRVALVLSAPGGPGDAPPPLVAALHRVSPVLEMHVGALGADDVAAAAAATGAVLPPDAAQRLHRRSGGLPLLLAALLRDGAATGRPAGPATAAAVADLLSDLSADARAALAAAAAVGRVLDPTEAVNRLHPSQPGRWLEALDELLASSLLDEDDAGRGLRFRHDVVREVVLGTVAGRRERLRAHLAAGRPSGRGHLTARADELVLD